MGGKTQRVNEQIRAPRVRVIGPDGQQLGILSIQEALAKAREAELDLVEVAPDQNPPVCRIIDYGKFKYQQKKRQKQTHHTKLKEIRLRPQTGEHDIQVKINHAREFLEHRDKVLVSVQFTGREKAHIDEGRKVLDRFLEQLADIAKIESPPTLQGGNSRLVCLLAPK